MPPWLLCCHRRSMDLLDSKTAWSRRALPVEFRPLCAEAWSPAGGHWPDPVGWRRNTAIAMGGILIGAYFVWSYSKEREVRRLGCAVRVTSCPMAGALLGTLIFIRLRWRELSAPRGSRRCGRTHPVVGCGFRPRCGTRPGSRSPRKSTWTARSTRSCRGRNEARGVATACGFGRENLRQCVANGVDKLGIVHYYCF